MTPDIKIRTLVGPGIKTYIPSIVKVREQIISEFPYLRVGGFDTDLQYINHLSRCKDAIAVIIFDGSTIVGVSTGVPLIERRHELQNHLIKLGLSIKDYYYFDLSALLKPYRNRGIAHHFFDLREEHVAHLKRFSKICFSSISPESEQQRSTEPMHLEAFWKKRGYVQQPAMGGSYQVANQPYPVTLKVWVKDLRLATPTQHTDLKALLAYD